MTIRNDEWRLSPQPLAEAGLISNGQAFLLDGWVYATGVGTALALQRAPVAPNGEIGAWSTFGVPGVTAAQISSGSSVLLPSGIYGSTTVARYWQIPDGRTGQVRLLPGDAPVTLSSGAAVTCGGVVLMPASAAQTPPGLVTFGHFLSVSGLGSGPVKWAFQPQSRDTGLAIDITTIFRHLEVWGDWALTFGGYFSTGLTPVAEIRCTAVTPEGYISPNWRTIGVMPVTTGLNRFSHAIWKDYLIIIGGSTNPSLPNESSVAVWAAKLSAGGMGPWVALRSLPVATRSCLPVVIGDRLYVIGGVADGVASSTALTTVYSTNLVEGP